MILNFEIFYRMPFAIQLHMVTALMCLFLGAYMFWGKKGNRTHKILGWCWMILMLITATSAAFIHGFKLIGPFSPIHIFVPITFWGVYEGVVYARRKNIKAHRGAMRSMYWAALCIPFAFALMPGRLLSHFFGTVELEWIPMSLVALIVLSVGAYYRWERMWQGLFDATLERVGLQKR